MGGAGVAPWRGLMRQLCTIAPRAGEDSRGKPTYGAAVNYRCRMVRKEVETVDAKGRIMTSGHTLYLASADLILPDAQLVLSTADVGSTEATATSPPIIWSDTYPDERGPVYTAVRLK